MAEESQPNEDSTKSKDKSTVGSSNASQAGNENIIAALAYLGVLFFLPLVITPESKLGRFHANQGLVLFLAGIVLNITFWIFALAAPFLFFFTWFAWLAIFILALMGFENALNSKQDELPVIGNINLINK